MMNVVAICLVLTSMVIAGVRTPAETMQINQEEEVIVKEGHRTVEIEYEGGDEVRTKVNIFPQENDVGADCSSVTPEIGHGGAARELVCDAFGKCKHKVAQAFGKSKEILLEKAYEVKDKVGEVEGDAKHVSEETQGKVKDGVKETSGSLRGKTHDTKEKVKEAAQNTKEKLEGVAKEAIDTGNTLQTDVKRNSTEEFKLIKRYAVDFLNYLSPSGLWASGSMKLLGLSVAYGTTVWVTFISSYIAADALPRQQFVVLQSRIYPIYFKVMAFGVGMLLLSHSLSSGQRLSSGKDHFFQALNLLATLVVVLFNLKYLEPRANKIMLERMKLEKEEGRGMERPTSEPSVDSLITPLGGMSKRANTSENPSENPHGWAESSAAARTEMAKMSEQLKNLNSLSSFLNMITLMLLTWHLIHLGQIIHP